MADRQHDAGSKTEGAEMTDDLVKRLREHAIHLDAWGKEAIHDADIIEEAADRIEKLEDTVAMWNGIHEGAVLAMHGHIKELQAALREIAYTEPEDKYWPGRIARKALGENNE